MAPSENALLWESLQIEAPQTQEGKPVVVHAALRSHRLPYNTRCVAVAKSGRRCKARVRKGSDFCAFHDPSISKEVRRKNAAKGGRSHNRIASLPDGYLRKLANRASIGDALDRLYRETRHGIITVEMARVLFDILTRILDSGLLEERTTANKRRVSKADRIRPKMESLLTAAERRRWRQALANAPADFLDRQAESSPRVRPKRKPRPRSAPQEVLAPQPEMPIPAVS
jgi:hypothetical protein